jgi:hypothetical protein
MVVSSKKVSKPRPRRVKTEGGWAYRRNESARRCLVDVVKEFVGLYSFIADLPAVERYGGEALFQLAQSALAKAEGGE